MENKLLLKKVSALGLPLFEAEDTQDANHTLAEVVKSKDLRLWEGFAVVLANCAEKGLFNYDLVKEYLSKPSDKSQLEKLLLVSLALYEALNLKFSWADKFYNGFSSRQKKEFNQAVEKLKKGEDLKVDQRQLCAQRLKAVFNNYFQVSQSKLNDLLSAKQELGLEFALSQVFSVKQKELFLKKLRSEKMTKTEKEYFSRAVKKKVLALANSELHRLAQKLLG